jgi:hypothetical protein
MIHTFVLPRSGAVVLIATGLLIPAAWCQGKDSPYYRFQLDGNAGYMSTQGGNSSGSSASPGGGFTVGYRAVRHFMVESGVDFRYGNLFPETAAIAQDSSGKQSSATITDHTLFVPIGGRAVLPLQHGRVLLSAGGGVGVVHNYEKAVGGGSQIDCNGFCTSHTTAGPYETVQALFLLDKRGHFGAGFGARFAEVKIKGGALDSIERNNWLQLTGTISCRF